MRVIILAAGPGTRWGGHLGVPKHLVPVDDGEPLLHRLVRQLRERRVRDVVISGPDDDRYRLEGARLFMPKVSEEDPCDKYVNCRSQWSDDDRTVLLYGDTFYTDEALNSILGDDSHRFRLAYCYRNPMTGHRWGGCAAVWFWPEHQEDFAAAADKARDLWLRRKIRPGSHSGGKRIEVGPWHILTVFLGLNTLVNATDAQKSRAQIANVMQLRDWTADFDWPAEYDGWKQRRDAYLMGRPLAARQGLQRLSILVPFRDADGTRTPAKEWIVARWRHYWPDAELIEGTDDGVDPFNKSAAVNDAASRATGDILIILDADTWVDPERFGLAIQKVESGFAPWGRPGHAYRLRKEISERLMRIKPSEPLPPILGQYAETSTPAVGFLWIVPREGFVRMGGMDERIRGWGGEDSAFTIAADRVIGHHRNFSGAPVISLWHPRPRDSRRLRVWPGQDRAQSEGYKGQLLKQYRAARSSEAMLRVLAEAGGPFREAVA